MDLEHHCLPQRWYFSRQEIEDSPSRKDGIDLCAEMNLRKLYCSFLKELGMKLRLPQQTIATAIVFCHRFYMRQSHVKNDWKIIAVVCMFLSCKVEGTRINNFVVEAYKQMYKWDPRALQIINKKEVFDQFKNLVLIGEKILLATIDFDMNIEHPYKPLIAALKNLNFSNKDVPKIAWNCVNDSLRTTLCLQYKPHYVAAGSLFLAALFLKVELPIEKWKAWWMQCDVSPKLLEGVAHEMYTLLNTNSQPSPSSGRVSESKCAVRNMASNSLNSCTINGNSVDQFARKYEIKVDVGVAANTATSEIWMIDDSPSDLHSLQERTRRERTSQESNSGITIVSVPEDDIGKPRNVESYQIPDCKLVSSQCVDRQLDTKQIRESSSYKRKRCKAFGEKGCMVNH